MVRKSRWSVECHTGDDDVVLAVTPCQFCLVSGVLGTCMVGYIKLSALNPTWSAHLLAFYLLSHLLLDGVSAMPQRCRIWYLISRVVRSALQMGPGLCCYFGLSFLCVRSSSSLVISPAVRRCTLSVGTEEYTSPGVTFHCFSCLLAVRVRAWCQSRLVPCFTMARPAAIVPYHPCNFWFSQLG